jgi:hypothetical protein
MIERPPPLAEDAVLVALIRESLLAETGERQAAAKLMLLELRHHESIDLSEWGMQVIRADEGAKVAAEVQALAAKLGLG